MRRAGAIALLLCFLLTACATTPAAPEPEPPAKPAEPVEEEQQPPTQNEEAEKELVVYTDWSKLEPKEEPLPPIGSQWYEETPQELIPSSEYGPLIPYAGIRLMDDWPADSGCKYGLMTPDGTVVTAPVYSGVYQPGSYDASGVWQPLPLLVLKKGDPQRGDEEMGPMVCAVAAADGSWCTDFAYQAYAASGEGLLLFEEDRFSVMEPDGTISRIWTAEEIGITQVDFDGVLLDLFWGDGWGGQRKDDYMALGWDPDDDTYEKIRVFHLETGEISALTFEEWDGLSDTITWQENPEPVVEHADYLWDSLWRNSGAYLLMVSDYSETSAVTTYYHPDGTPIPQLTLHGYRWDQRVSLVGGLVEVLEQNMASYYQPDTMECVFRTYLSFEGD